MHIEGKDLSELSDLIAVPLAPTPPYRLDGHLAYAEDRIRFDDFASKVGSSDLKGKFAVDLSGKRPSIVAEMTSQNVDLTDLGGFIGATPGKGDMPDQSDKQKEQHAATAAKSTLLPDKPIDAAQESQRWRRQGRARRAVRHRRAVRRAVNAPSGR
jgi:hypothetical protein